MIRVLCLVIVSFYAWGATANDYFTYDPNHPILSEAFQAKTDILTDSKVSLGNRFKLLPDTDRSLAMKIEIAQGATESIYINTMIYVHLADELMEKFSQTIIQKAKEGVEVYLLSDHKNSYLNRDGFDHLRNEGVKIHFFNRLFEENQYPLHILMHEKYMVVDHKKVVIGGQNMSNQSHNRLPFQALQWRDTDLYVEGPLAQTLGAHFEQMWNQLSDDQTMQILTQDLQPSKDVRSQKEKRDHKGEARFLYNEAYTGEKHISKYYLEVIKKAKYKIYWQGNHMLLPDDYVMALIAAANRGVDVTLATNSFISSWYMPFWHQYHEYYGYRPFLGTQVKVQLYQTRFNHSKTFYVDGVVASIGSLNHDKYSLINDAEATVISYDRNFNRKVYGLILEHLQDTKRFWLPF